MFIQSLIHEMVTDSQVVFSGQFSASNNDEPFPDLAMT